MDCVGAPSLRVPPGMEGVGGFLHGTALAHTGDCCFPRAAAEQANNFPSCEGELCLPGPTQAGMDGDQFGICDSQQAGQVSRRELEEATA